MEEVKKRNRQHKPPPEWRDLWHPRHFDCPEYKMAALAFLSKRPDLKALAAQIRAKLTPHRFQLWTGGRWGQGYPKKELRNDRGKGMPRREWWFAAKTTPREFVLLTHYLYTLRGNPDATTLHLAMVIDPVDVALYLPESELKEAFRLSHSVCRRLTEKLKEVGYGPDYEPTPEEWWEFHKIDGPYPAGLEKHTGRRAPWNIAGANPANRNYGRGANRQENAASNSEDYRRSADSSS